MPILSDGDQFIFGGAQAHALALFNAGLPFGVRMHGGKMVHSLGRLLFSQEGIQDHMLLVGGICAGLVQGNGP